MNAEKKTANETALAHQMQERLERLDTQWPRA